MALHESGPRRFFPSQSFASRGSISRPSAVGVEEEGTYKVFKNMAFQEDNSERMHSGLAASTRKSSANNEPVFVSRQSSLIKAAHASATGSMAISASRRRSDQNNTFLGAAKAPSSSESDDVMHFGEFDELNNANQVHAISGPELNTSLKSNASWISGSARLVKGPGLDVWLAETHDLLLSGRRELAVSRPAPSTGLVQSVIKINKAGLLGKATSIEMHLQDGMQFLLAARKRKKSKASNYVVSQDAHDLGKDSINCVGKFRANFVGTEYTLCSRSAADPSEHNHEEVCIFYKQTVLQSVPGPRVMLVATPSPEVQWSPVQKDGSDSLPASLEKARLRELAPLQERKLSMLATKPPEWDEKAKAHVLDFHGRVKKASVKNFQLVAWDHNSDSRGSEVVLQFGRVDDDTYILDFAYPLTAKRAFAIALASLDTKLAFAL